MGKLKKTSKKIQHISSNMVEVSLGISEATDAMTVVASKKSRSPTPVYSSDREGSPSIGHCHASTLRRRPRLNSRRSRSRYANSGHLISDSNLFTKYLNSTNQRNPDNTPLEISIDPVEEIGNLT